MSGTKADEKPKKPLNAYFKFRSEKWPTYGDVEGKKDLFKKDWENIDPKYKS